MDRSKAYEQGYDAYMDDKRLGRDNPYPEGSTEAEEWERGWLAADFDYPGDIVED